MHDRCICRRLVVGRKKVLRHDLRGSGAQLIPILLTMVRKSWAIALDTVPTFQFRSRLLVLQSTVGILFMTVGTLLVQVWSKFHQPSPRKTSSFSKLANVGAQEISNVEAIRLRYFQLRQNPRASGGRWLMSF